MATRSIYTFKDQCEKFHVYKHWDGYPESACQFIKNALGLSFEISRFEACEFATAFIAANKKGAGDICLLSGDIDEAFEDIAFFYEIHASEESLYVKCWRQENRNKPIFEGTLEEMEQFCMTDDKMTLKLISIEEARSAIAPLEARLNEIEREFRGNPTERLNREKIIDGIIRQIRQITILPPITEKVIFRNLYDDQ